MTDQQSERTEPWLGLCTPFVCLSRRERHSDDVADKEPDGVIPYRRESDHDSLDRLTDVYEGLFRLDRQIILLKSREAFIKSCLTDAEQFNIKIIAKGINDMDGMTSSLSQDNNIEKECLKDILSGLKLPSDAKLVDAVKVISYHLINKLSYIQHDIEDLLREYDSFHNATIDIYENMRKRFFDLTLSRPKGEHGIDFSVSKKDFMYIANCNNEAMVDIIFSVLDDGGTGVIDWGAFELNSGRILKDASDFVKTSPNSVN
ncbi:EF hand family protein, putative [Babesia ovis]|uniref:EF hand family protein, putative n=1 Tax=Babesia ovis TaxID=5869 RepID=A0A9W5WTV4_BABOV|nr:EF hand family protein, putative [Babesia ovis]